MQYELIRSRRARGLRITVGLDGAVRVHAPVFAPLGVVRSFVWMKRSWIISARDRMGAARQGKRIIELPRGAYLKHKEQARQFVHDKLEVWNRIYGFSYRSVSVRNQKARWGSCSAAGNLSFNYKLLFLPEHLADYVVVHELAHLAELNHSARFWALVGRAIPEYKKYRRELRSILFSTGKRRSSAVGAQL